MTEKTVLLDIADRIATITIAREQRRNSVDNEALEQIGAAVAKIRREDVAVIIVSGQGTKAFCAGSDLKALASYSERDARYHTHLFLSTMTELDEFPCATIAAIEGFCLGGGLELALTCDYRIASQESKFGFPEIKVNAMPTGGGTIRAPRALGLARAREMLLFGGQIDAQKALDWGLVSEIVPAGTAFEAAKAMARDYASKVDGPTVGLLKRIIMSSYEASVRTGDALAYLGDYALVQSDSFKKGVGGFADRGKTKP